MFQILLLQRTVAYRSTATGQTFQYVSGVLSWLLNGGKCKKSGWYVILAIDPVSETVDTAS